MEDYVNYEKYRKNICDGCEMRVCSCSNVEILECILRLEKVLSSIKKEG